MGKEWAVAFGEALQINKSLQILGLSNIYIYIYIVDNQISDEGAVAIGLGLAQNNSLKILILGIMQ